MTGMRGAVRALRSNPHTTLEEAAQSSGVTETALRAALLGAAVRGDCAATARSAALNGAFRMTAMMHRGVPPPVRRALACDEPALVAKAATLAATQAAPMYARHDAAWCATSDDYHVRAHAAIMVGCSPAMAVRLADDSEYEVRLAAIAHRSAAAHRLRSYAQHRSAPTRRAVAAHPATPTSTLHGFAHDPDFEVHIAVANNPRSSGALLRTIATITHRFAGPNSAVLAAVAANLSCPSDVLEDLCQDSRVVVQAAAAANPRCSPGSLRALAKVRALAEVFGSDTVTDAVASNRSCPPELLRWIFEHSTESSQNLALANPSCPADLLSAAASGVVTNRRAAAATNPACDPATLEHMIASDLTDVAERAAGNPNCPTGALARAASNTRNEVRVAALRSLAARFASLRQQRTPPTPPLEIV